MNRQVIMRRGTKKIIIMKIKVTESELVSIIKRIVESDDDDIRNRMKRREGTLSDLIEKQIEQEDDPNNFGDEFEFADNIISWALDEFISQPGNEWLEDSYDDLMDYAKEKYGNQLFDIYYSMESGEDDNELDETITEQFNGEKLHSKDEVVRMLKGAPSEIRKLIKKLPNISCENSKGEKTICTKIPEIVHVYLTGRY